MKLNLMMSGLLAAALGCLTADACTLTIRVACPNDKTSDNIEVSIAGVGSAKTDSLGIATLEVPSFGTYTVCVNESTLPTGATIGQKCQKVKVDTEAPPVVDFVLGGSFCGDIPPQGPCWMTGGGTIDKVKGKPSYSYGGVVYPGCSPKAADGGNWNVIDHANGLHFQGKHIIVDSCSGVSTRSPRVNVNIIDFHGDGTITGIGGNPEEKVEVTFVGRAVDNLDGGAGNDLLYIEVQLGGVTVLQIGNSAQDPATITTGNIQIHTSSCGK